MFYSIKQALESLNKKDMTEIKSYAKPPGLVEKVLEAVMILRGNEPTWLEAKKQLGKTYIKSAVNILYALYSLLNCEEKSGWLNEKEGKSLQFVLHKNVDFVVIVPVLN